MSQEVPSQSPEMRRQATAVGLFVALGLPFLVDIATGRSAEDLSQPSRIVLMISLEWFIALVLVAIVLFWERQPLGSIGIRMPARKDITLAFLAFIVGALTFVVTAPVVQALGLQTTSPGIERLAQVPFILRVAIVLTAGITEEILFRGFPIERLNTLTGRLGISALIAYTVFVLLHLPFWGVGGALQVGVWTIVVTLLYVARRNLTACMLMHILNDAYAFLLLPLFLPYLPK